MFETTVVAIPQNRARRARLLTISLGAHTAVILGAIGFSIATVEFPATPPDEVARAPLFAQVQIPPPLGNPDGGAAVKPAQPAPQPQKPAPPSDEVTAPALIPDDVPQLEAPGSALPTGEGTGTGTQPGPIGVPWGFDGGLGPLDGPPATDTTPQIENRIYEINEVKPPRIIQRVDPPYPQVLIRTRMKATVIVRCVIDREGRVRDAQIVRGAMPSFNDAVLQVLPQWRFSPGMLGSRAVETYMTLTVHFDVR